MTTRIKRAVLRKMPRGLTLEKAKMHVMKPAHTSGIQTDRDDEVRPVLKLKKRPRVTFKTRTPKLNVDEFGRWLGMVLNTSTAGYAMELRRNGTPIYGLVVGWAQTPNDSSLGWKGSVRMHVASVSKLLTAIGLLKLLDGKGISLDQEIFPYLPAYWSKGPNVEKITFRHLLRHRSGLGIKPEVGGGKSSASDFAFMKKNISLGPVEPGSQSKYQNVNYGLMRILISVINGDIDADYRPAQLRDVIWDALTINYYRDYMQQHVFTPAGVANAGFAPPPAGKGALAYSFPPGDGWNTGDLQTLAGGCGWRLSVGEVLNVMDHFRRKNTIVSAARAQEMLDAGIALNGKPSTPAGTMYFKKGAWISGDGRHEKCIAYFWPDGMEMVIFVNSPIHPQDFSLHAIVRDIYLNSLE